MPAIESSESSSPIVTKAVAAGLNHKFFNNYSFPFWQEYLLSMIGAFPQGLARNVISHFEAVSGLDPNSMKNFLIDTLLVQRLEDYVECKGPYKTIVIGAALGGASAYLSLVLNALFLPQAFVTTLKGGSHSGNVDEYLHRSLKIALRIADENPAILTIQHFDPVHDGWMTRFVNHLRFKLLSLPTLYATFIANMLEPEGTVVFLNCQASWLHFCLGPRSIFQVGGWGGISAEEFLEGSDRVSAYAKRVGFQYFDWKLKDYPLESGPESEWGTEPGLETSLKAFCESRGYRFIPISLKHPNDFSKLALMAAKEVLKKEGRQPSGVLVEMFTQFDSFAALQSGLLPLWLIFNTKDSLEYLKEMLPQFPAGKPVFFSPLATFSLTPDIVKWQEWEDALAGFNWINIGTRPNHYPADARALVNWFKPLRKWVQQNTEPIVKRLDPEELLSIKNELFP